MLALVASSYIVVLLKSFKILNNFKVLPLYILTNFKKKFLEDIFHLYIIPLTSDTQLDLDHLIGKLVDNGPDIFLINCYLYSDLFGLIERYSVGLYSMSSAAEISWSQHWTNRQKKKNITKAIMSETAKRCTTFLQRNVS